MNRRTFFRFLVSTPAASLLSAVPMAYADGGVVLRVPSIMGEHPAGEFNPTATDVRRILEQIRRAEVRYA